MLARRSAAVMRPAGRDDDTGSTSGGAALIVWLGMAR
jgi:hypothetical protein